MFPEGKYYVTTTHGVHIVRGFTLAEYFHECRARDIVSYVQLYSVVPMDTEEFEDLLEYFEQDCPHCIFDNGEFEEE
jgi:hypothetical protein